MAPQTSIPVSATVLGMIGTVLWCIQLCPQIWKSYRTKSTEGLPSAMMLLWGTSGAPFGVYAISQNFNIPLQVQPQFFCLFCLVSWAQVQYYSYKWSALKAVLSCCTMLAVIAGLEVLFVLVFRGPYGRGESWAAGFVTFVGILACVMLISGYIPIPQELIKRRGRVAGISLLFLAVDWSGAFFSLMSLVAQHTFDITFGVLYALVAIIEGCMFISHGIWYLRTRDLRRRAREAGATFDEFSEAIEWQGRGWDIGFETLWAKLKRGILNSQKCNDTTDEENHVDV